jgi:hypothetical protein
VTAPERRANNGACSKHSPKREPRRVSSNPAGPREPSSKVTQQPKGSVRERMGPRPPLMRNGVAGAVGVGAVGAVGGGEQPDPEFVRRGIRFLRGTYSPPGCGSHLDAAGEKRPRVLFIFNAYDARIR